MRAKGIDWRDTCPIDDLKDEHLAYCKDARWAATILPNKRAFILVPRNPPHGFPTTLPAGNFYISCDDPLAEFAEFHNGRHPLTKKPDPLQSRHLAACTCGCRIDPSAVIGGQGFRIVRGRDGRPVRLTHVGGVYLGSRVEIGANTTVDRGMWNDTIIWDDVKIDNLVQIGHNARIREGAIICACAVIGGSAEIGEGAFIGLNATILPGIKVGARAVVGAGAVVTKDVREGATVAGVPAREMMHHAR